MGKKTQYVPFDWLATQDASHRPTAHNVDDRSHQTLSNAWGTNKPNRPNSQSSLTTPLSGKRSDSLLDLAATNQGPQGQINVAPSYDQEASSDHGNAITQTMSSASTPQSAASISGATTPSQLNFVARRAHDELPAGFKDLSIKLLVTSDRDTSEHVPAPQPSAKLQLGTIPTGPSLTIPTGPRAMALQKPTSRRARYPPPLCSRFPVQSSPLPGEVYFLPDGRHFPYSMIHNQKRQDSFFLHPVLIFEVGGNFVGFYALTTEPPRAIRELNMSLRLGENDKDIGSTVLTPAAGSDMMLQPTWVNLEQRFYIEWENLDTWARRVHVDPIELNKITKRIVELEAAQNRFIYKPLPREMSTMQPGMIIMLPNAVGGSTFGAPVLIVQNNYPNLHFLRVKRFIDNKYFNPESKRPVCSPRLQSLEISKTPKVGHDGTPVLVLTPESPEMRETSYVEVVLPVKFCNINRCKTWCWPPVQLDMSSMGVLYNYIANVSTRTRLPPTPGAMMQHHSGPVYPHINFNGYHQPHTDYHHNAQWQTYNAIQQPSYHKYPPQPTPSYPTEDYKSLPDAGYYSEP
jgi:hypothetical protein